jgi:hypothetical protein
MQQTALNTIAIGVFILTIISLISPIFQISPLIPTALTIFIMGLATVDTFSWQNRGATLFLSLLAGKKQKERVLHHEAGHFIAAYYLGIPIISYTLTPWEGIKQGLSGVGGVVFDFEPIEQKTSSELPLFLDRFSTVLMAGIAAEKIIYGNAEGGAEDREKLQQTFKTFDFSGENYQIKERRSQLQATNLIQRNQEAYLNLVEAMKERKSVEDCCKILSSDTTT